MKDGKIELYRTKLKLSFKFEGQSSPAGAIGSTSCFALASAPLSNACSNVYSWGAFERTPARTPILGSSPHMERPG